MKKETLEPSEILKQVVLVDPNGNLTALVPGIKRFSVDQQKLINTLLMTSNPQIEQVAFYEVIDGVLTLVMPGGELCINAIRALAYFVLKGQPGRVTVTLPSIGIVEAGVEFANSSFIDIPSTVVLNQKQIGGNGYWEGIVEMNGISHLVTTEEILGLSESEIKQKAREKLNNNAALDSVPAAGVMFCGQQDSELTIIPYVSVKNVSEMIEKHCGSGTLAVISCLLRGQSGSELVNVPIRQPQSNEVIFVSKIQKNNKNIIRLSGRTTLA
jgi:diaminopimelate epimerase